ncbi:unnamed protein product [Caenorhabditis bovis]|uniref:Fork-head domain-containing protein n=1 Tax=Caenorhabditis bovis TaxID=2654633 RepID=A0A8S1EAS1_9PELO|nr:unnamed protein product [Caenorhabditis bovis]
MDDKCSGMEMMLSAVATPIEDDDWQLTGTRDPLKEALDSAAQSPSSSLFDDFDDSSSSSLSSPSFQCDSGSNSLSSFDMMMNMFLDPTSSCGAANATKPERSVRKSIVVRRRTRECSMVCWLFRTLLTSEYRALPINAIYEIFEDTIQSESNGHGRHYRQSIRHSLMTSAVFVRVLTPNPRKDFLVMNEQGSWWTVHPDCEVACAESVFCTGSSHRCPPNASIPAYFSGLRKEEAKSAGAIRQSHGLNSEMSSTTSSSASSAASTPTGMVPVRRFDPIRRVTYGQKMFAGRTVYKRLGSTAMPITSSPCSVSPPPNMELLNPRSILLNDIAIDHEEEVA